MSGSKTWSERISYRPATRADIPVLRFWDEQPHVKASDPDSDWNWEEEVSDDPSNEPWWREQWMVEVDRQPVGFLQLMDTSETETGYWGSDPPGERAIDIWIGEADLLGQGLGTEMMTWAIMRCFEPAEVSAIAIDPLVTNTRAHRFYERFGFTFVEEQVMEGDACRIYRLSRADWESRN